MCSRPKLTLQELPPGAYLEDDYIVLNPIEGRDDEPYYPDPYVFQDPNATYQNPGARAEAIEPPWSTGWNTERSPAHTMNASASTGLNVPMLAESFPSEPKILYAEARTGNERQHVGTLRKKRLEKAIYECLKLLCPLDDLNRGMNPCTPKNTKSCRVDHIVYNADPHPKYATNAHLEIYIDYAYHNPKFPGIGDAVVSTPRPSSIFSNTNSTPVSRRRLALPPCHRHGRRRLGPRLLAGQRPLPRRPT
jgi:hypothetical protein